MEKYVHSTILTGKKLGRLPRMSFLNDNQHYLHLLLLLYFFVLLLTNFDDIL